jgi:HlyD family secretion protein
MRAAPLLGVIAIIGIAVGGYFYWSQQQSRNLPAGLASANGRIEVERVDIATKMAGRIAEIRVREGDAVRAGDIVARMDVTELQAQLLAAKAAIRRAIEAIGKAEAEVAIREAEQQLSEVELRRVVALERRAAVSTAEVDRRRAENEVAKAQILGAKAAVRDAQAAREAAEAHVAHIEATIADMTLKTPVSGRVEYRLAQAGEVLAAGGRVVTILDLSDVFMTIFLPTSQAGRVAHGSEARIVLDAAPSNVVLATVSFIAAEAQFTPKAVETSNEREKLMYRVKLAIDPKLLETYRDYVRAGLTGNAYVRTERAAEWPANLTPKLPPAPGAEASPETAPETAYVR